MNLSIYKKRPDGNIQVIEQTTDARGREVHLKFTQDPHNPTKNHYDAILLLLNEVRYLIMTNIMLRVPVPPAWSQLNKIMKMT